MDIYVLDTNFEKLNLVEGFTSFIWKEKYAEYGDFKLRVPIGHIDSARLSVGNYIYIDDSRTLMIIERLERDSVHSDGHFVTVSGRSLHSILLDKSVDGWSSQGRLSDLATRIVNRVCVLGNGVSPRDVIPNLGITWPSSTGEELEYETGPNSVYNIVTDILSLDDLGFRLDFNFETKRFNFRVNPGVDRSDYMIFGPELGNLNNVNYLRTIEDYRNVAYVTHRDRPGTKIVYRHGHGDARGLNRRVIHVDASSDRDWNEWRLRKAGIDALNDNGYIGVVDGEVISDQYVYNHHYSIGDLVQIQDDSGRSNTSRVTEYIWSYDQDGFREFPTFTSFEPFIWSD